MIAVHVFPSALLDHGPGVWLTALAESQRPLGPAGRMPSHMPSCMRETSLPKVVPRAGRGLRTSWMPPVIMCAAPLRPARSAVRPTPTTGTCSPAAITAGAQVIVTRNLRDLPRCRPGALEHRGKVSQRFRPRPDTHQPVSRGRLHSADRRLLHQPARSSRALARRSLAGRSAPG